VSQQSSPEALSCLQDDLENVRVFQDYAELLMSQIERRVLEDETIPTKEKNLLYFSTAYRMD
jgi:hypothetical protein